MLDDSAVLARSAATAGALGFALALGCLVAGIALLQRRRPPR
jgi:hypothetical protein